MITTIGVFNTHSSAESALNELKSFGVNETDLSYVYTNGKGNIKDGQSGEKVGGAAATGATAGAIIGGLAGLVVANVVLPGFGTVLVAGPLAAALGIGATAATAVAGAAGGAVAGGMIGGLTNLGVAEADVHLYEDHVRRGDVLIIARGTPASTEDIFLNHGATDVRHYNMN